MWSAPLLSTWQEKNLWWWQVDGKQSATCGAGCTGMRGDCWLRVLCRFRSIQVVYLYESTQSVLMYLGYLTTFMYSFVRNWAVRLPSRIVKLVHLRSLDISGSNVSAVPKGFCGLTNLRTFFWFPAAGGGRRAGSSRWCSLQELAPLSQLGKLTLAI